MQKSDGDIDHIERAFCQARFQLGLIGSARDEVERRIAVTSIKSGHRVLLACSLATLVLFMSATLVWWRTGKTSTGPHGPVVGPASGWAQDRGMDIGDIGLTEHMAAIIQRRVVVVIWSYRGKGVMALPTNATNATRRSAGKYELTTLQETRLANGRTVVCSLLIPDAGVRPILEPPSIYATSADNDVIALSVSPRSASTAELAGAIRSAEGNENAGIRVEDILRAIGNDPK